MDCLAMKELQLCSKCGNSHEGGCSTEAVYFYWFPDNPHDIPSEVLIVGDWTKWHRREKMNKVVPQTGLPFFSILLALSEGRHEYKYIVDGSWRCDRHTPSQYNPFGALNNTVEILPKKSYIKKTPGQPIKLTCSYSLQNLKIMGSWDNWAHEHPMTLSYNPLKKRQENQIQLDLKATNTYQFIFKHKNQFLIDQKYPTVNNSFGSFNNFTIVYNNKLTTQTPKKSETGSSEQEEMSNKDFMGNIFSWRRVDKKIKLPYERIEGHNICCVGEYLYVFGGKSRSEFINTLIKINSTFDKMESLEAGPDGRAFHHMKVYGNKLLVSGGNNQQVLDDYIAFNVSDNKWLTPHKMPKSIKKWERHSCVLFKSLLIFFGGCFTVEHSKVEQLSNDLEVLDLERMEWIQSVKLQGTEPSPRFAHTADLINSDMYVFGGINDLKTGSKVNDLWKVNLLNVNGMKWQQVNPKGQPPQPRHGHTMNGLRNLLIIFGGMSQTHEYLNDLGIYNSTTNEWMTPYIQGSMPKARFNHASANLFDRSIVIFGGKTQKGKNNQFFMFEPGFSKQIKLFNEEDSDIE